MASFSLLDNLLSTILMVEAILTVILLVPFGNSVKTSAVSAMAKLNNEQLTYAAYVILALVVFLFVANSYTASQLSAGDDKGQLSDGMQL